MNEAAMVITALAGVITSIAGLALALSKMAPVMTALNKMLADHHKRTIEAQKHSKAEKATASVATIPLPGKGRWFSSACIAVSYVCMLAQAFSANEPSAVIFCIFNAVTIVLLVAVELTDVILRAIFVNMVLMNASQS